VSNLFLGRAVRKQGLSLQPDTMQRSRQEAASACHCQVPPDSPPHAESLKKLEALTP
jgi:hypothetical protein